MIFNNLFMLKYISKNPFAHNNMVWFLCFMAYQPLLVI